MNPGPESLEQLTQEAESSLKQLLGKLFIEPMRIELTGSEDRAKKSLEPLLSALLELKESSSSAHEAVMKLDSARINDAKLAVDKLDAIINELISFAKALRDVGKASELEKVFSIIEALRDELSKSKERSVQTHGVLENLVKSFHDWTVKHFHPMEGKIQDLENRMEEQAKSIRKRTFLLLILSFLQTGLLLWALPRH